MQEFLQDESPFDADGRAALHRQNSKAMRFSSVHFFAFATLLLAAAAAGTGLFYAPAAAPHTVVNQYGDTVRLWGGGLYAHDSYFRAPIYRGTDAVMLLLACPLLLAALLRDAGRQSVRSRMQFVSVLAVFVYYAASLAFGAAYNFLHLVYAALFGASLFGLFSGLGGLSLDAVARAQRHNLPYRGIFVFLALTGLALYGAWLPDIVPALANGRPLALIETYTTEPTYILDMGLIAPLCLACIVLLKRRRPLGLVLLHLLLTVCLVMGVILPVQTLFQDRAGITLPLPVLLTRMGSFCALAVLAAWFRYRLLKSLTELRTVRRTQSTVVAP